jgi:hypothetical protein
MQTPWFLQYLDLTTEADAASIKRTYAVRLRQIDPAKDINDFMRLREAHRLALDWHARRTSAPVVGASTADPLRPSASRSMAQLREQLRAGQAPKVALRKQLQALRDGHLPSSVMFELMVIDALASSGLPQRLALFQAAREQFPWSDASHLMRLGPRGQWISTTVAEETAWRDTCRAQGGDPLDRLGGDPLVHCTQLVASQVSSGTAVRWPDMQRLLERYPRYLSLRCEPTALGAWEQAFDALPSRERALAEAFANSPSPAAFRQALR